MTLSCIGNIFYWTELLNNPEPVIYLNHTFQKQSELSQYDIVTANGRLKLSVPTQKSTRKGSFSDVKIDPTSKWQVEHWRSIENAYLKSPFFLYYGYKIEVAYNTKYDSLVEFNLAVMHIICDCLKLKKHPRIDNIEPVYYSKDQHIDNCEYPQVFDTHIDFVGNTSILDLIFNLGPEAKEYLINP